MRFSFKFIAFNSHKYFLFISSNGKQEEKDVRNDKKSETATISYDLNEILGHT